MGAEPWWPQRELVVENAVGQSDDRRYSGPAGVWAIVPLLVAQLPQGARVAQGCARLSLAVFAMLFVALLLLSRLAARVPRGRSITRAPTGPHGRRLSQRRGHHYPESTR